MSDIPVTIETLTYAGIVGGLTFVYVIMLVVKQVDWLHERINNLEREVK